jgi:hypothetical protein
MKKYLFVAVLVVLGTVLFAQAPEWRITATEGGARARDNQITLRRGENYVYVYFDPSGVSYEKIRVNFTISSPLEVIWQCVYMPGAVIGSELSAGSMDKGPIETGFDHFKLVWFGGGPVNPARINGICLKVNDPVGRSVFKMTDVQWVGLK